MTGDQTAQRLLGGNGPDPGCDECLARLHVWAEAVLRGEPGDRAEPLVAAHLRSCRACAEDADGLLALSRESSSARDA
jgi:hypothetical protein